MSEGPFGDLKPANYRAIYADPPWTYSCFSPKGEARSAKHHYPTMDLAAICALPVGDLCADDAHLFLWATGPNLKQAFDVITAWGFRYSAVAFTWIKMKGLSGHLFVEEKSAHIGMGHTTRGNCEWVLLGRRGRPKRKAKNIRELILSPRREHSRKPDEVAERIELYCDGPYLELFARQARANWDAWGNEVGKFAAE